MLKEIVVENLDEELRVDKYLPDKLEDISRSELKKFFEEGKVRVNDKVVKPSFKVKNGDIINVEKRNDRSIDLEKEDIPLEIVYEDDDLIVVNKPSGMVVHPAAGHHNGTLVNALLHHCDSLSDYGGSTRAGIVHRIDKDTSGLLVVCKNDFAHNEIAQQLKDKTMHREYYALCKGVIKEDDGKIVAPIGRDPYDRLKMAVDVKNGKEAITYFHVLERFNQYTFISVRLQTGRTHQIRVHMHYIGHPLEGDPLYGKKKNLLFQNGQLLHAYRITFIHPRTKKEMTFEAPLPEDFKAVLERLRK